MSQLHLNDNEVMTRSSHRGDIIVLVIPPGLVLVFSFVLALVQTVSFSSALFVGLWETLWLSIPFGVAFFISYLTAGKTSKWRGVYFFLSILIVVYAAATASGYVDYWYQWITVAFKAFRGNSGK